MKKYMKFLISAVSLFAINTPMSMLALQEGDTFNILESVICNEINYTLPEAHETEKVSADTNIIKKLVFRNLPYAEQAIDTYKNEEIPENTGGNTDTAIINEGNDVSDGNYHNGNPLVLIYHTHTTESYCEDVNSTVYRNADNSKNMVMIGDIMAKVLHEEYGIEVLHITQTFDAPYDTAYDKSLEAAEQRIAEHPTIAYAFDVHRDGLSPTEESRQIYKTNINGTDSAKVMMVLGNLSNNYTDNYAFAELVGSHIQNMYPGLYKSTIEKPYRYNQYIASKCILFEVGSNLSTPSEAQNAAVFLARALGNAISADYYD